ncbi:putative hydrolase protein [Nemania sp. FL0031]|nr:putative hydrolase protein [Nemania sp. FL0031]
MATSGEAWKPGSYGPSKTALLLLDYENAHVNMIDKPEEREKVIQSTKQLLTAARENNVAIVHCLMDASLDPPPTGKGNENWYSVLKPMVAKHPEMLTEYSEFTAPSDATDGGNIRESTSYRNPAYGSALVNEELLLLLRDKLEVKHLIMSGITTSNSVLGTARHATDLGFVVTVVREACWDKKRVHSAVHSNAHIDVHIDVSSVVLDKVLQPLAWVSTVDEAVGYMTASEPPQLPKNHVGAT